MSNGVDHMKYLRAMGIMASALLFLILTACGGNNGDKSRISNPTPTLTLSPITARIALGKSETFTVTATNTDFTVTGDGCAKNSSTTVICTPTKAGTYELTVTAAADTTLTRKATITVVEVDIALTSDSNESEIKVGETKIFTVTTTNTEYNMSVEDEAGCVISGNNASEIICTPTAVMEYNLVVTAKADTTKTARATFSAYEVGISIAPSQAVIVLGHSETFKVATVRTDFDMDVDSAAGCAINGNEITCTPTAAGEYKLTVTAKADTTKTMTSDITVNEVGVTIDPTTKSVTVGEPAVFTVTALNTDFDLSVEDEAGCVVSGDEITCTPTVAGTYELVVTAKADMTKTMTATITATPDGPEDIDGMVFVEAGTFRMGCVVGESGSNANSCINTSQPAHQVKLNNNFYIGKYEVTQAEWKDVMGDDTNPSEFKGDNLPVTNVTWDDVQEFIVKLNLKTGRDYRLPTEAEWEYAARGGNNPHGNRYSASDIDDINTDVGWGTSDGVSQQQPVGTKKPNTLGIYDMSGNVSEWVNDWYDRYSGEDQEDPSGPENAVNVWNQRVTRGGGWSQLSNTMQVWWRNNPASADIFQSNYLGFRLALTAE